MCELCGYITDDEYALRLHRRACDETPLTGLGVLLEAELILMEHQAQRKACGCPRHQSWRITSWSGVRSER
ncbi:hypothetical protein LCGC14_1799690 [marine sediment metagenome]|uniref:Uncharacterized protein n=1 Tax=marine sediment metagenome TaxID=412755 RepID=A0A0F9J4S9_9ZZZZ